MLVLERQATEQIQIGPSILITVVEVTGGKVRLGIDAPRELGIHRPERGPMTKAVPAAPGKAGTTAKGSEAGRGHHG